MDKFCKDCRHVKDASLTPSFWECKAPASFNGTSPLTGETVQTIKFCSILRETTLKTLCGTEGRWFHAAERVSA
jgi:hypothetical protein